jgi:hypothetical protein
MDVQGQHHAGGLRRQGSHARPKGMLLAVTAALLALLLVPAAGRASVQTIGPPNLAAFQATVRAFSPEDDLFTLIAEGAQTAGYTQPPGAMPADGQVMDVMVEGGFFTETPPASAVETEVHIQDLTHVSGGGDGNPGTWQVNVTSQPFPMFASANATDLSGHINDFKPENLCVHQGDLVDLNSEGGFEPGSYPYGVPLQAFASVPNSVTGFFTGHNKTMNGALVALSQLAPPNSPLPNAMLLMQVQLASGSDVVGPCRGVLGLGSTGGNSHGPGQPGGGPDGSLRPGTYGVRHDGTFVASMYCKKAVGQFCTGSASPTLIGTGATANRAVSSRNAKGNRRRTGPVSLGSGTFKIPGHTTGKFTIRLTKHAVQLLRKHHRRLHVTLVIKFSSGAVVSQPITLKL